MQINSCFVIMGFNVKRNEDGKEYNLNKSYEKIIKPVLENKKIEYIRADEIMITEIIDESMYQLLLNADLVIADITTLNPNALYELGVRFALKPFSTIIIADINTKLPFDINHLRVFTYEHGGKNISTKESFRMQNTLSNLIDNLRNQKSQVDSPIYKYIKDLTPPKHKTDNQYFTRVSNRFKAENNFCSLINMAYTTREQGKFDEAINIYRQALKITKDEYVIKEIAMCMYQKGDKESILSANNYLYEQIDIQNNISPEILKTLGTINKKLWQLTNITQYAVQAFKFYEKSFIICNSYNSGLNYGLMSLVLSSIVSEQEKETYYLWGKSIYKKVRDICLSKYDATDYWINASLEECYFALEQNEEYLQYKEISTHLVNDINMEWKRAKTLEQLKILENFR